MNSRDRKLIKAAINIAKATPRTFNVKMAAIIATKKEIIAVGVNKKKSHPIQAKYGKNEEAIFVHAEIDAIIKAMNYTSLETFEKATLYIARVKKPKPRHKNYVIGLAKPCEGCVSAIKDFNIGKVIYTTDTGIEEW